jgi:hypothetical protein
VLAMDLAAATAPPGAMVTTATTGSAAVHAGGADARRSNRDHLEQILTRSIESAGIAMGPKDRAWIRRSRF